MKKKRLIAVFILFTMIVSCAYIPASHIGDSLYGNYVYQDFSKWCWATSAENAIIWEGNPTRTRWDAVYYIKGTPYDPFPNVGGTIYDIALAAEYISGFQDYYYGEYSTESYSFLCEQMYASHPIICVGGYYDSNGDLINGHAVLVCGWYAPTYGGNYQYYLTYFDPANLGYRTCTYSEFCNGSYNNRIYDRTCYHS